MKNAEKKVWSTLFVIGAVMLFMWLIFRENMRITKGYKNFYTHNIAGQLNHVAMAHSRIEFTLMGNKSMYMFTQETKSHQQRDFYETVHFGDSIFKKPFSDSILIKNNKGTFIYMVSR